MTPEGEGKEYGARSEKREARSSKREIEARSTPEALSVLRYPQIEVEIRKVELSRQRAKLGVPSTLNAEACLVVSGGIRLAGCCSHVSFFVTK